MGSWTVVLAGALLGGVLTVATMACVRAASVLREAAQVLRAEAARIDGERSTLRDVHRRFRVLAVDARLLRRV